MDAFTGEIRIFCYTWAPAEWAFCTGQAVSQAQYQALYAVIGNTYNASNTPSGGFGLPNLQAQAQACIPIGATISAGTAAGMGTTSGADTVQLALGNLPAHTHTLQRRADAASTDRTPGPTAQTSDLGSIAIKSGATTTAVTSFSTATPSEALSSQTIGLYSGQFSPHPNDQPYLAVNFYICLNGVFPIRP